MKFLRDKTYNSFFLIVLCAGFVVLPLFFWPYARIPFEVPKVSFVLRWVEILALTAVLGSSTLLFKKKKLSVWLIGALIGFLAIAVIASLFGADLIKSIYGNAYRGDGLLTLFHLVGFALLCMLIAQKKWWQHTALWISVGVWITSIWSVLEAFRFYLLHDPSVHLWPNGGVGVSFGQPNFLGGYFLVTLPFAVYVWQTRVKKSEKLLVAAAIFLQILALCLSFSKGSMLGIPLLILGYLLLKWKKPNWVLALTLLCIGIFVSVSVLYYRTDFVPESRERIYNKVILGYLQRPILGWGWANVDHAFQSSVWPIAILHDVNVDKAHSLVLESLVTTGPIGLTFYLGILAIVYFKLYKNLKTKNAKDQQWAQTLFLVFLLFLYHSQTNIISISEEMIFWFVVGIS